MEKVLLSLPFSGFYQTLHMDTVDREIEFILEDREELTSDDIELKPEFFEEYAKRYTQALSEFLGKINGVTPSLEFKELVRPREYNFSSDIIYALVDVDWVEALYKNTKIVALSEMIKSRHSSHDGFISHYSDDICDWIVAGITEFDHNMLETLILANYEIDDGDIVESYCLDEIADEFVQIIGE